jgi:hypothetical protein
MKERPRAIHMTSTSTADFDYFFSRIGRVGVESPWRGAWALCISADTKGGYTYLMGFMWAE